jgi:homoserine O-acetyltransferase
MKPVRNPWGQAVLAAGLCALAALAGAPAPAAAAPSSTAAPATSAARQSEGDFVAAAFHFASGEELPELRLHYLTFGEPHRDEGGRVDNAVLILHGTGGSARSFINDKFSAVLFGPGQLLDAKRYFLILPDSIGHGKSSKPSDGLHAQFPHYDYADMVEAQYRLLTQALGVDHLRLIIGTSMGCMHAWLWGETRPEFVDALMPLACLPEAIAGRNRVWRDLLTGAIRADPAWQQGEYRSEPEQALRTAAGLLLLAGSAPLQMQRSLPTPAAADEFVAQYLERELAALDANDLLYQVDASRDYDPAAGLERISAVVCWVNSADDFINPPELKLAERDVSRVKNGRFVLLPTSEQTHGHGTHTWAVLWQSHLRELLDASRKAGGAAHSAGGSPAGSAAARDATPAAATSLTRALRSPASMARE